MKISIFTRYDRLGSSSRVRFYQYVDYAKRIKYTANDFRIYPLFEEKYLKQASANRFVTHLVTYAYIKRVYQLLRILVKKKQILIIEKELFPFFPALAEVFLQKCGISYIADYDDATFHRYDQHSWKIVRFFMSEKIATVIRLAGMVTVGNKYLASYAEKAGAQDVFIIPSVIDFVQYDTGVYKSGGFRPITIGWIGSHSTTKYLTPLTNLMGLLKNTHGVRVLAIGADGAQLNCSVFEVIRWSEMGELDLLAEIDIGIMPLSTGPWELGKCGYKIVQYMGAGIPVVASAIGANNDIVRNGESGWLVSNELEWKNSLETLIEDFGMRKAMGSTGKKIARNDYSIDKSFYSFINVISSLQSRKS